MILRVGVKGRDIWAVLMPAVLLIVSSLCTTIALLVAVSRSRSYQYHISPPLHQSSKQAVSITLLSSQPACCLSSRSGNRSLTAFLREASGLKGQGGVRRRWAEGDQGPGWLGRLEQRAHLSPALLEQAALFSKRDGVVEAGARAEVVTEFVMGRAESGGSVEGPEPAHGIGALLDAPWSCSIRLFMDLLAPWHTLGPRVSRTARG